MRAVARKRPIAMVISIVFAIQIVIGLVVGSAAFTPGASLQPDGVATAVDAGSSGEGTASHPQAALKGSVASVSPRTEFVRSTEPAAPVPEETVEMDNEQVQAAGTGGDLDVMAIASARQTAAAETGEPALALDSLEMTLEGIGPESLSTLRTAKPEAPTVDWASGPVQVFPLIGGGPYSDSYGAPRDGGKRQHKGIDIFASKMTPIVAVTSGTVVGAPKGPGETCCYLKIRDADGNQTVYLHMNNDTPGTDDGLGWGLADGIEKWVEVTAGQVIGYVGDSGNAEETDPHLHFEYRLGGTDAVDPYELLVAAPIMETESPMIVMATPEPATLPFTGDAEVVLILMSVSMLALGAALLVWDRENSPA